MCLRMSGQRENTHRLTWQGGWRISEVLLCGALQQAGQSTAQRQRSVRAEPAALHGCRGGQPLALRVSGNVEEALPPLRAS